MATKLNSFDFSKASRLTVTDKATYPWDEWFDGDIWQLTSGEDFEGHPLMMERVIRTRASGRNAKISLRHVPVNGEPWGIIVLQRNDIQGPKAIKKQAAAEKRAASREARNAEVTKAATAKKPKVDKAPPVKKVSKTVSKRPARRLAAVS